MSMFFNDEPIGRPIILNNNDDMVVGKAYFKSYENKMELEKRIKDLEQEKFEHNEVEEEEDNSDEGSDEDFFEQLKKVNERQNKMENAGVKKMKHLMVDLETLGKTSDSIILSIGAVSFEMDGSTGPEIELFPLVDQQITNRKIEWSTIQWWMKQEEKARLSIADAVREGSLLNCLLTLDIFCKEHLDEKFKVWANGAAFDIAMLNHAFDQYKMLTPWSYRNVFDCRTMVYMSKISTKKYEGTGVKHSAIDDCKWQISWLVDAYKILRED